MARLAWAAPLLLLAKCGGTEAASAVAPDAGADTLADAPVSPPPILDVLTRAASVAIAGPLQGAHAMALDGSGLAAVCDGAQVTVIDSITLKTIASAPLPDACLSVGFDGAGGIAVTGAGSWRSFAADGTATPIADNGPAVLAVALAPGWVYAAGGSAGIVSAPRGTAAIAALGIATDARDVALVGGDLFVADGTAGIKRIAVADDAVPVVVTSAPPVDVDWAVAPFGEGRIVAARGGAGIAIFDTTGGQLTQVSTLDTRGMATGVTVSSTGLALVADWTDARLVDLRAPGEPRLLGREPFAPAATRYGRALGVAADSAGGFLVLGLDHVTRLEPHPDAESPSLHVDRLNIQVEALPDDGDGSAGYVIFNDGPLDLHVDAIAASSPRIAFLEPPNQAPMTIPPGDAGFMELVVTGAEPMDAVLTYQTDDPDYATVEVPIRVNPSRSQPGDTAPDFVLPALDGSVVQLSKLKGRVVYLKLFNAL